MHNIMIKYNTYYVRKSQYILWQLGKIEHTGSGVRHIGQWTQWLNWETTEDPDLEPRLTFGSW